MVPGSKQAGDPERYLLSEAPDQDSQAAGAPFSPRERSIFGGTPALC